MSIPDPSIPAGHTLMPERERQETLESLKESRSFYHKHFYIICLIPIIFQVAQYVYISSNRWYLLLKRRCVFILNLQTKMDALIYSFSFVSVSILPAHRSLVSELLSLPVRADSLGVRSRRAQLDRRLSEVEEAIKIFSRDKVYIKTDS